MRSFIGARSMLFSGRVTALNASSSLISRRRLYPYLSLHGRFITVDAARRILGLTKQFHFTLQELRQAYFVAAKKYHPDAATNSDDDDDNENTSTASHANFISLTQAYQLLQDHTSCGQVDKRATGEHVKTDAERELDEAKFRAACEERLGVAAEIVEECKASPEFLQWLSGRTDAAQTWRDFFVEHGGLGPMLRVYSDDATGSRNKSMPNTQVQLGPRRRKRR